MSGRRFHTKGSRRLHGTAGGNHASNRLHTFIDPQTRFEFLLQTGTPEKPSEPAWRDGREQPPTHVPPADFNSELLNIALQAAVPLRIQELRKQPLASVMNRKRLEELGDAIGSRGDLIMFGSKKAGRAEDAFNKLAEALARLAFVQGGVTFNGVHYEASARSA